MFLFSRSAAREVIFLSEENLFLHGFKVQVFGFDEMGNLFMRFPSISFLTFCSCHFNGINIFS